MAFIVNAAKFQAEGAFLQWQVVARRLGMLDTVFQRKLPSVLQLRWTLKPELGLPTEPFIVWRRNRKNNQPKPIQADINSSMLFGLGQIADLQGSYTHVTLNGSGGGGAVYGFVGSSWPNSVVAIAVLPPGANQTVTLTASSMEGLMLSSAITINSIVGVRADDLSAASGWEKFELVGLPVRKAEWAGQGIGLHGTDQGMVSAPTNAVAAAGQRLERGAPPIGWASLIEAGLPAPAWIPTATPSLLIDLQKGVLQDLRTIAGLPPVSQPAATISKDVPGPENSAGEQMSQPGVPSNISPLGMTYIVASTDCYNSLALGFGTAYPLVVDPNRQTALDFDYMVTARYEKGPLAVGAAVEYAALVPSPQQAIAPPIPAAMAQQLMGNMRPAFADGAWRASVRTSWDRPVPIPLFRPRSFAFARTGIAPVAAPALLMNKRSDGSPLPIAVNYFTSSLDPEPNRLSAVDREIPIPNNPGNRTMKYSAANQDIYGQYSKWVSVNSVIEQPRVDDVRIVSAEFRYLSVPTPPLSACTANLVLEFLWDWRVRSPLSISFRGRLHTADYHGQPPPDTTLPNGLQISLAAAPATTFTLRFDVLAANGAPTGAWPGYVPATGCIALNPAGDQQVAFGAAQGGEARRYRVTIPGFTLDFASKGHLNLALWAEGVEAIAPQRVGPWSKEPSVISTSDPRPPLIVPDIVSLSSLPDAAGESHAVLKWAGSPGADGYFIYETTETKLLKAAGETEPDPSKTLSQRLTRLLQIFDAQPANRRREFTRRNSRLLKTTSADVTLPRGSTAIHLYLVLGVSAGQVEAKWPTSSTALYAFAVPRVPKPGAPTIEVVSKLDNTVIPPVYRTSIRLETRKGPRVRRIDLHRVRVDDAAKEIDTMGPPVLTLDTLTPGWDVTQVADPLGSHIVTARGKDTPTGSWKRVWYRAAAWSDDDLLRGTLSARSPSSTVAWAVVPPATPPDLSAIVMEWPGTAAGDVLLKWSSAAPLPKTPLGPHTLSVRARRVGSGQDELPLISFEGPLPDLGTVQPATGSGAWRVDATKPAQYRAIIRRADVADAVEISVRVTDPIGRSSEALATIGPGSILPDPVLDTFQLVKSVVPAGVQLNWHSSTPIDPGLYTLRITVNRPAIKIGNFPIRQLPISIQMGLSDVPLDEPGPVPAGIDSLRARRMPGPGPNFAYYAFVRVAFTQIIVRLTSPDGRVAQHIELPS
ncbi:hypothetical protein [Edaphobacter modestus]|uniref:Uncharacterized protein n=1 Tax=Edaphobacter modestus TaxID=388466 RepID=A0A4Q7YQI9_9BACT|nr:hypothetical protein [Edaphobacter modestus]RZU39141.1 hypothetical protein BDD14_0480 [Edaphobacter modestus]